MLILTIIELLILIYFLYVVSYTAFFSVAGRFYRSPSANKPPVQPLPGFCILIPSYKEDIVIYDTARKALEQSYPKELFDVVIIADSLQPGTLARLKHLPIKVFPVAFKNSTKVKSLNKALDRLPEIYDYAVILDADNVMEYDFLEKLATVLMSGYDAVQGQRKPKNSQTDLAFLDGISEAINNHIYRQGNSAAKLSASINGSGVAFTYSLLKEKLAKMTAIGGFDRELELLLLREGVKVKYLKEAVVYDEKVSRTSTFQNQRKRWISSQYFYLKKYFIEGLKALLHGNVAFFNSSVLRNIQLPRLVNIGSLFLLALLLFPVREYLSLGYFWWPLLFGINSAAIFLAIPKEFYSYRLFFSIIRLPALFARMASLLFRLKGANKKFIHTSHEI